MAICRMFNLKEKMNGYKANHLSKVINYIQNPDKTEQMKLVDAVNCFPETALEQMMHTKRYFGKEDGRQGYHFVISFKPGEATVDQAGEIVREFVHEYLENRYETIWAIHTDHEHIHGHIVFNSVSFVDGIKYHYNNGDFEKNILPIVNRLCSQEKLSTICMNPDKPVHENYKDYTDRKMKRPGPEGMIMADLDQAIREADTFDGFLRILNEMGYETKTGKYLSIRPPGRERFKRTYHFGKDYEIPEIKKRILRERPAAGQAERKAPMLKLYKGNLRSRPALTKLQKRAFARMYKAGKLRRGNGGSYFRYREEIMKFKRLKAEYEYLYKNRIRSLDDLEAQRVDCLARLGMLKEEKSRLKGKAAKYYKVKHLLEGYQAFGDTDEEFRLRPNGTIGDSGYTEAELKEYVGAYEMTRSDIKRRSAIFRKELEVILRIEAENSSVLEKDKMKKEEKEKEKPDGRKRENGMEPGTERSH